MTASFSRSATAANCCRRLQLLSLPYRAKLSVLVSLNAFRQEVCSRQAVPMRWHGLGDVVTVSTVAGNHLCIHTDLEGVILAKIIQGLLPKAENNQERLLSSEQDLGIQLRLQQRLENEDPPRDYSSCSSYAANRW